MVCGNISVYGVTVHGNVTSAYPLLQYMVMLQVRTHCYTQVPWRQHFILQPPADIGDKQLQKLFTLLSTKLSACLMAPKQ
jgi:hypothetical protein